MSKTKITAQIVADSTCNGNRITSFLLTYPRFIHGELMTHRMFSRNSASSRAIPFKRMVEAVVNDPFIPIAWQKSHNGMQGSEYLTNEEDLNYCINRWLSARDKAVTSAARLHEIDVTKQICNRILEPFMWHTTLVTATEFDNFFELRCPSYKFDDRIFKSKRDIHFYCKDKRELDWLSINHSQAEIHISTLAEAMWDARNESTPKELKPGEWHIPYEDKISLSGDNFPYGVVDVNLHKVKISTAMCARTSYTIVGTEKEISYETLIGIHDRMIKSKPFHASPFEHCAKAMSEKEKEEFTLSEPSYSEEFDGYVTKGVCRNFKGFIQYRHIIENGKTN